MAARQGMWALARFLHRNQLPGEKEKNALLRVHKAFAPPRLDILSEADAPKKALVKELKGIGPAAALTIPLRRVSGKPPPLCGLEVSAPDATKPRR